MLLLRARSRVKRTRILAPFMGPAAAAWGWMLPRMSQSPAIETQVRLPTGSVLSIPPRAHFFWDLWTGLYEKDVADVLRALLTEGMGVIDTGANIGYHSILMSELVGPSGRVYAFEPDPHTFGYLQRNMAANNCTNVELISKAVSDQSGEAPFVSAGWGSFIPRDGSHEEISSQVQTTTIDAFFKAKGWPTIDLIKMDIEGSELAALLGMGELSRRNSGLTMIMEFNIPAMRRAGTSPPVVADILAKLRFGRSYVIEQGLYALPDGQLLPDNRLVSNLLLVKSGLTIRGLKLAT